MIHGCGMYYVELTVSSFWVPTIAWSTGVAGSTSRSWILLDLYCMLLSCSIACPLVLTYKIHRIIMNSWSNFGYLHAKCWKVVILTKKVKSIQNCAKLHDLTIIRTQFISKYNIVLTLINCCNVVNEATEACAGFNSLTGASRCLLFSLFDDLDPLCPSQDLVNSPRALMLPHYPYHPLCL